MQPISSQIPAPIPSDEELIRALQSKYGICESEARALDTRALRIRIASLDFLANNLPGKPTST
jgi:hypothetical protein